MTDYQEILVFAQSGYAQVALAFLRIAAALALLPAFGERVVPMRVKLAIAFCFSLVVGTAMPELAPLDLSLGGFLRALVTETVIGLMLGISLRLLVLALQTAGAIAAQSTSLSQLLGGASVEPLPALGHILVTGALALAVISGLHVRLTELFILSYQLFPVSHLPSASEVSEWGVGRVAHAFRLAFTLAMPFVILSVLYNLTLGAINRAMPQLMVAFVGAPVITFGGVFMLFLLAPQMLALWLEALQLTLENPFGPGR